MPRLLPICAALGLVAACVNPYVPKPATLEPARATAVDLIMVGGARTYCPHGDPLQVKAVVTLDDGSRLETWSSGTSRDGKLPFTELELSSSYGVVDDQGRLQVPADPFAAIDTEVTVTARLVQRPDLVAEVSVAPSFACGGVVAVAGDRGVSGRSGVDGRAGRTGQSGNSDRAATDGEHGGHGQDGGDGGHAGPGPELEVALGYVDSERHGRLVLVRVGRAYFLVDPEGQPFAVAARGGSGGSGGSGGRGGAGGAGGSNNVVGGGDGGDGGDGGAGGNGGNGGDGGEGGRITVYVDAAHPELRELIRFDTGGGYAGGAGSGGYGGSPGAGGSSADGQRGQTGRSGVSGQSGVAGRAGRDGPPPSFEAVPAARLFAEERRRGIPVAVD
jgi:hypothetical protein